ncbi:hypothetical protein LTR62_004857 [Meristemomyces frigidus]|uniref:Uncharacterized protein n=1 Tax=Meristemomyces frigidus TaxID=1508187 RepID=A0AAN7YNV6_9PEZI|nr:hypothetical protein LTR62_004857 [Meristemomyces frigidus]
MSTPRVFNIGGPFLSRNVWSSQAPYRCYQRRWAQVHDVRFVASHQSANSVQEKYRAKLEQKAREKGLKSVDDLKEEYQDSIKELRQKATVPGANAPLSAQAPPTPEKVDTTIPYQEPPPPSSQTAVSPNETASPPVKKSSKDGVKSLDSFIDVEKTSALPPKEIESIWRLRHVQDGQSLCAIMKADTFSRIAATAKKHPQFILPLPREGQGAEIHFLQWTFPSQSTATVMFTHLAEFKLRGEYAQPHTIVTHHLDLAAKNNVVLLEGRVTENKGLTVDEGRWLLMCLQKFYGFEALSDRAAESKERRQRLMRQFSGGDEGFKVEELLEEAEKVP